MKKFALKAAVIAIAGYLGVVGYIHQYDKGQSEKLLAEGNYSAEHLPNNRRLPKFCLIMVASIVIPRMLICLSTRTFPSQILS